MANRVAAIKQADLKRVFKAGLDAGFPVVRVVLHPDGRIEASASLSDTPAKSNGGNSWDDILK